MLLVEPTGSSSRYNGYNYTPKHGNLFFVVSLKFKKWNQGRNLSLYYGLVSFGESFITNSVQFLLWWHLSSEATEKTRTLKPSKHTTTLRKETRLLACLHSCTRKTWYVHMFVYKTSGGIARQYAVSIGGYCSSVICTPTATLIPAVH